MREGQDRKFARHLRRNATNAERLLWRQLRARQLDGFRFRRQVPIGPYFADFACIEARLIVEVDGGQHNKRPADERRDRFLVEAGFTVLRVWNNDVMTNMTGVCELILRHLESTGSARPCPHPSNSRALAGARRSGGAKLRFAQPRLRPPRAGEGVECGVRPGKDAKGV